MITLVPNSWGSSLLEDNDCHNPAGSSAGGQFCSKEGPAAPTQRKGAQVISPGQSLDLIDLVRGGEDVDGLADRRFLFDPQAGTLVIGVAQWAKSKEFSHAHTLQNAGLPNDQYDRFTIHGHFQRESGPNRPPLGVLISRVLSTEKTSGGYRQEASDVEASDQFVKLGARLSALGVPASATFHQSGAWQVPTMDKVFPEFYPKRRKLRKAA